MKRNLATASAAVLALALVLCEAREALAQEIVLEGPLVGQPAVRELMLLRKGRLSIAPDIGFTLVDDFRRNIILGGRIEYNIFDWISIGVWGGYSLGIETPLTKEIKKKARSNHMNLPRHNHIGDQIGKLNWITTLQINVIPFRGKMALFSKLFLAADIYIFFGGGVAGVEDRGYAADDTANYNYLNATSPSEQDPAFKGTVNCTDSDPADGMADNFNNCLNMKDRVTFVPTFGVGVTLFVNKWMSLNIEYRALPFRINKPGTDEVGMNKNRKYYKDGSAKDFEFPNHVINDDDRVWHFNHSLQISYAFYFNFSGPGVFKPSITD